MKIIVKETIRDFAGRVVEENTVARARFTGGFIFLDGYVYPPLKSHQWEPLIDEEVERKLLEPS